MNPDVEIVILGSDRDESIIKFQEVDISVVCGTKSSYSFEDLEMLAPEVVKPVCSPSFLAEHGPFKDKESLLVSRLLHLHTTHWSANAIDWAPQSWQKWFGHGIIDEKETIPGFKTNSDPHRGLTADDEISDFTLSEAISTGVSVVTRKLSAPP